MFQFLRSLHFFFFNQSIVTDAGSYEWRGGVGGNDSPNTFVDCLLARKKLSNV
jgi:actin-related protein